MQTEKAIRAKMELLTSRNFPEAQAARQLLEKYIAEDRPKRLNINSVVEKDLALEVARAWRCVLADDEVLLRLVMARVLTTVWLLGGKNTEVVKRATKIPYTESTPESFIKHAGGQLVIISEHYDLVMLTKSEEENGNVSTKSA